MIDTCRYFFRLACALKDLPKLEGRVAELSQEFQSIKEKTLKPDNEETKLLGEVLQGHNAFVSLWRFYLMLYDLWDGKGDWCQIRCLDIGAALNIMLYFAGQQSSKQS